MGKKAWRSGSGPGWKRRVGKNALNFIAKLLPDKWHRTGGAPWLTEGGDKLWMAAQVFKDLIWQ